MKKCKDCRARKDESEFYPRRGICKKCYSKMSKFHYRERIQSGRDDKYGRWARSIQKKFGISAKEYFDLLQKQDGTCAICRRSSRTRRLAVDHSHKTGRIRGLLCGRCNGVVVSFIEDDTLLSRTIQYLA